MSNKISTYRSTFTGIFSAVLLFFYTAAFSQEVATPEKSTAVGTSKVWGIADGIAIQGLVQGPSAAEAPLQVACVFEYIEGDIFNPPALPHNLNGMVHLDEALHGQITELRKSGKFAGHYLETLLITPPKGSMKAPRLLLIGLGDRNKFDAELMTTIGAIALREAVRMGVSGFSFASDIKDAGIDSRTADVAGNVTKGIINAWHTQQYLQQHGLAPASKLKKVILLAGPAFFETAGEGIRAAIESAKQ